jgi:hypothetical protein
MPIDMHTDMSHIEMRIHMPHIDVHIDMPHIDMYTDLLHIDMHITHMPHTDMPGWCAGTLMTIYTDRLRWSAYTPVSAPYGTDPRYMPCMSMHR